MVNTDKLAALREAVDRALTDFRATGQTECLTCGRSSNTSRKINHGKDFTCAEVYRLLDALAEPQRPTNDALRRILFYCFNSLLEKTDGQGPVVARDSDLTAFESWLVAIGALDHAMRVTKGDNK